MRCPLKMCTSIRILVVILYGVVAEWNTKDHMKREHSLTKPYIGNDRYSVPQQWSTYPELKRHGDSAADNSATQCL